MKYNQLSVGCERVLRINYYTTVLPPTSKKQIYQTSCPILGAPLNYLSRQAPKWRKDFLSDVRRAKSLTSFRKRLYLFSVRLDSA